LNTGSLSNLDGIISASATLDSYTKDTSMLSSSTTSKLLKTNLQSMSDDIRQSYLGTDSDSPTATFNEFNKYTDSSVSY